MTGGLVLGYCGAILNAALALILLRDLMIDYEAFKREIYGLFMSKGEVEEGGEVNAKIFSTSSESTSGHYGEAILSLISVVKFRYQKSDKNC